MLQLAQIFDSGGTHMNGTFIVLEGGEGSGKSSHVEAAKILLEDEGYSVVITREPGGTETAEDIRSVIFKERREPVSLKAEQFLFWAAREIHMQNKILPALAQGDIVLCDRFDASTFAYQLPHSQERGEVSKLFNFLRSTVVGNLEPTYIWLDVDPDVGLERVAQSRGREINHFDERSLEFHRNVRKGYKEFFETVAPCHMIDANQKKHQVQADLMNVLRTVIDPL